MEIYVVQQGDTVEAIAVRFGISVQRLIVENELKAPYRLVIGQTLVITYPVQVYTVREGDTLAAIAEAQQIDLMELLRNNPFLAERQYIYPGETLIIRYDNYLGSCYVVGYTYPRIRETILKKTLPFLAYLLIYNYRVNENGELIGTDQDVDVINTANLYGAGTTMVITTFTESGTINLAIEYEILLNPQLQDVVISNILSVLKEKGYNGVNLAFQFVNVSNQQLYLNFLAKVKERLNPEGYSVFLTLNPGLKFNGSELSFERLNYTEFSNNSDGILFLSYDWGSIERPPLPYPVVVMEELLEYIVEQVPLEKIRIGLGTVGYDWTLPYIEGRSRASALNFDSVLELARQNNAIIQYDEASQTAYFEYIDTDGRNHIVWFKDARSIDSSVKTIQSYGIKGIGIWNIMYYFAQMWLVINTQYQIVKL